MHLALLNVHGNFDPQDSLWAAHPDFGGQLVYVKNLALALGRLGHQVDIITRRIVSPQWPQFALPLDTYPGHPNVRIVRIPFGPPCFLSKEELWPFIGSELVPRLLQHYADEETLPDIMMAHYADSGISATLIEERTGTPFSFTAHSLGAQKMDSLRAYPDNLAELNGRYHFGYRLLAERLAMNRSLINITSTMQERDTQYAHPAYRGAIDPADDSRFAVVRPGVAMALFDRAARHILEQEFHKRLRALLARDLLPTRLGLPCVVAASRLDAKKNLPGLVEAFATSSVLREHANLVIITSTVEHPFHSYQRNRSTGQELLDQLLHLIEKAQLHGQVALLACCSQEELGARYRFFAGLYSVFALTSFHEPFGLAPLEAMAAGLPAVVTSVGGPSESLRSGSQEYALLVDPHAPQEIAAALLALVSNPSRWQHHAEVGYQWIHSRYTWKHTAQGYLAALEAAAKKRHRVTAVPDMPYRKGSSLESEHENAKQPPMQDVLPPSPPRLPIHPYFLDPRPETDVTLDELAAIYSNIQQ